MLQNAVRVLDEFRLYCGVNAQNFISNADTLEQSIESNYANEITSALAAFRSALDGNRGASVTAALLRPILREYARLIDTESADNSDAGIIDTIEDYFVRQSISIQTRTITYGTPTASSANVGTGLIHRLRMDADGVMVENIHATERKVARCTKDGRSGAVRHEETFSVKGELVEPDRLLIDGSGTNVTIKATSARDSLKFLTNPSFSDRAGTDAAPTEITGWAVSSAIGNFQIDRTNLYRDFFGDANPGSVIFEGPNETLTQNLSTRNVQFNPTRPIYCQIAWNAQISTATGNLRLILGTASATVAISGVAGWNVLRITIGSGAASASNAWFENFNRGSNTAIQIQRYGGGANALRVDDVILTQWEPVDGSWYVIVGGRTIFRLNDRFVWTDTETGAKIQRALWEGFGAYLRHSGTPTIADP